MALPIIIDRGGAGAMTVSADQPLEEPVAVAPPLATYSSVSTMIPSPSVPSTITTFPSVGWRTA
jgi:hypothetical protein